MSKKKIATEAAVIESYTVFYSGEAEKISPHSKGLLTYELGKEGDTGSLALRLTANGEGGLFSREWIALDAIHAILEQQQDSFPSRVFCCVTLLFYTQSKIQLHQYICHMLPALEERYICFGYVAVAVIFSFM